MKQINWKTEKRKINELIPFEGNPRKMNEKQVADLKKSLEKFNLVEIPAITTNNVILAGHQRLRILQVLGRGEEIIDVRVPDRVLTKEEIQEYNLRSNKNLGEWDFDLLANFGEEMLMDVGFESPELDLVFGLERIEDFDVNKELEKIHKQNQKRVKQGEVWKLGNHKLLIGNSTDKENWKKLLGDEKFDFMFTDPPYKISYGRSRLRKVKTKEGYKMKARRQYESVGETDGRGKPLHGFGAKGNRIYEGVEMAGGVPEYDTWLSIANEYQNPKGANIMIFEYWKNMAELWQAISKYWKIRNMIIWHAPNRHQGFGAKGQFFNKYDIAPLAGDGPLNGTCEIELDKYLEENGQKVLDAYDILMFGSKGSAEWNKKKGVDTWTMSDHITANVGSAKETGTDLVFGTKPLITLIPYIKILSPRGGIVMEPFCGSGSTLIASEIMKRKCYAIELSETYAEVVINRFEKFSGISAVKLDLKA